MRSLNILIAGIIASGVMALPMSAAAITWTFDNASASSTGTAGIALSDGTNISGSFAFDAEGGPTNTGFGNLGAPPPNNLGAFSAVDLTVTPGTILSGITGASGSWYIMQTPDDTTSDAGNIYLVDQNPALHTDLSDQTGSGAYVIVLNLQQLMADLGATPPGPATTSIPFFASPQAITTPGDPNIPNDAYAEGGYCDVADCSSIDTSVGAAFEAVTYQTTFDQDNESVPNFNHIWATNPPAVVVGGSPTPEPATFLLAGSMLVAIGAFRKKRNSRV